MVIYIYTFIIIRNKIFIPLWTSMLRYHQCHFCQWWFHHQYFYHYHHHYHFITITAVVTAVIIIIVILLLLLLLSLLFVSLVSHFWLIHFSPTPALSIIYRPLSSYMCSITPETVKVDSSYSHMRGPGIGCWFSDRSNCSQWSFGAAVLSINLNIYTDQWEPIVIYHSIT